MMVLQPSHKGITKSCACASSHNLTQNVLDIDQTLYDNWTVKPFAAYASSLACLKQAANMFEAASQHSQSLQHNLI